METRLGNLYNASNVIIPVDVLWGYTEAGFFGKGLKNEEGVELLRREELLIPSGWAEVLEEKR